MLLPDTKDWDGQPGLRGLLTAGSPSELRRRRMECQSILLEQLHTLPIEVWMQRVNRMHDAVQGRAVELCEMQMEEAGHGPPPCAYSFVVFGSAGRQEATLWSDQDNGLIMEGPESEELSRYFENFGFRLSRLLAEVGYEKCPGKVMCSEPMWRKTLPEWKRQLEEWRARFEWEAVRYLIIASDLRHIAGDRALTEAWLDHFHEGFRDNERLQVAVLRNTVRHKATLNLLGQVMTERFGDHAGGFDVKYGLYIPLVNSVRHVSLSRGIRATSTLQRLELLAEGGEEAWTGRVKEAFLTALGMRAKTAYTVQEGMLSGSDYASEEALQDKRLLSELRDSLLLVRRIHRALQRQLRSAERRQL
ncbi:DUF294 nucleotidyltransferase-like domain-containing protein [Paenibacillus glufosinatiresistens]|uniref:DUF294 nucleotidyltransferase-like domain-containing protein n=1 Tax=Paenibacillus glufosinatiresistens TaxID=3070657 RepID=UPI00286D8DAA|nr:DUF294 nucleotidyltransferase-like domain-containing protein [Paenibacillus sp. YX.27]